MIDFFHTFLSFYKNRPEGPVFCCIPSYFLSLLNSGIFLFFFSALFFLLYSKTASVPGINAVIFRTKYLSAISADSLYDLYDFLELTSLSSFFYRNGNSNSSTYHRIVTQYCLGFLTNVIYDYVAPKLLYLSHYSTLYKFYLISFTPKKSHYNLTTVDKMWTKVHKISLFFKYFKSPIQKHRGFFLTLYTEI